MEFKKKMKQRLTVAVSYIVFGLALDKAHVKTKFFESEYI